jgi:hypothetical protein
MRMTVSSMTSRLLVTAVALVAVLAVSGEARSSASGSGAQLLKTDAPVTGLAVDGPVVAVATPWPKSCLSAPETAVLRGRTAPTTWTPKRCAIRVLEPGPGLA